jgi:CRISPR-associated endonuclease/helicase Cas3
MRALGPLDSIAQAAGRCNREGSFPDGRVVVFQPENGGLPQGGGYKMAVQVTEGFLREGKGTLDIHDPALYQRYFQHLYQTGDGDARNIQALRQELNFPEVAASFWIIDPTCPVLVPYDDHAKKLINLVRSVGRVTWEWGRELQRYTIGLYEGEKLKALQGTISPINESGAYECLEGRYDPETGVQFGDTNPARLIQ